MKASSLKPWSGQLREVVIQIIHQLFLPIFSLNCKKLQFLEKKFTCILKYVLVLGYCLGHMNSDCWYLYTLNRYWNDSSLLTL